MPSRLESLTAFFAELRRRRVVRSALVYIGGAFVTLEMTGVAVETYRLPEGLQLFMGILAILGFPVALVLAWLFDWKDGRLQRAPHEPLPDIPHGVVRGALVGVVVVSMGAAAGVIWPSPPSPNPARDRAVPALAILPFERIDPADTLAWITPALEARLEDALSASPALELRSRRAVAAYGSLPLDSMARVLEVDYFVQVQVGHVGDALGVVVQLIDGATSTLLASERVERPGGEAMGLVAGLTEAIEQVLRPTLGREIRVQEWRAGTDNAVAFELRHRAEERLAVAESQMSVNPLLALRELRAADSILALSQRHDPDWAETRLARAELAERLALGQLMASRGRDVDGVRAAVEAGVDHADEALELTDGFPEARAVRGRLLYLKARYAVADAEDRAALIDRAEADLRGALRREPGLAKAAATLSQLLFRDRADYEEARWFAEQAYRQDAYMENSSQIINRIARSAFETGDDPGALHWCREGVRRFPESPVHHGCMVEVMAWGRGPAEPDVAWRHFDALAANVAPGSPGGRFYRMAVAAVLARAGLADSARAVVADVKAWQDSQQPMDSLVLMELEAAVRFRLGDTDAGLRLYDRIRSADRAAAERAAASRRLRAYLPPPPG